MSYLENLVEKYKRHNYLYWVENKPEISDSEFDSLEKEIRAIDPRNPALDRLHYAPINTSVDHDPPMLSMDKAYSLDEVKKWAVDTRDLKFMASPKYDGCACELRYYNGRLVQASTRGTGEKGEDITQNAIKIKNIPQRIKYDEKVLIRGEVVMPLSVFNKHYGDSNSNPRNLAAGSLKHKDSSESEKRGLVFYAYEVIGNSNLLTESDEFKFLRENNFVHAEIHYATIDTLEEVYNNFVNNRDKYDFEIDGVIFTANNVTIQKKMGFTSHHPKFAIAWKIQGDSGTTILRDIEWSVSRTGQITPVGILDPVLLSGAKVERATIHHAGFVLSKKLSKNCKVEMTRRGGVIPHIERVITPGDYEFEVPKQIGSFKTKMVGDFLYLENPEDYEDVQIYKLVHFCEVIEADGWGEKIITQLYKNKLIKKYADIYRVTAADLLSNLDRAGDKIAKKLVEEINKHKNIPLDVFLRALGIDELGRNVSKLIANKTKTLERARAITVDEMLQIDGVGEIIALSVVSGLKKNAGIIDDLLNYVKVVDQEDKVSVGIFSGKKFLFTGTLTSMDRKAAQDVVVSKGAQIASSVSKELNYLVVGGDEKNSTKYKKAESINQNGGSILIVEEKEFMDMIK